MEYRHHGIVVWNRSMEYRHHGIAVWNRSMEYRHHGIAVWNKDVQRQEVSNTDMFGVGHHWWYHYPSLLLNTELELVLFIGT